MPCKSYTLKMDRCFQVGNEQHLSPAFLADAAGNKYICTYRLHSSQRNNVTGSFLSVAELVKDNYFFTAFHTM